MKKIVALMALMAFTCAASAHCGSCEADGDKKPKKKCCSKEEGKCCKKADKKGEKKESHEGHSH
jgi:hypothetical protein